MSNDTNVTAVPLLPPPQIAGLLPPPLPVWELEGKIFTVAVFSTTVKLIMPVGILIVHSAMSGRVFSAEHKPISLQGALKELARLGYRVRGILCCHPAQVRAAHPDIKLPFALSWWPGKIGHREESGRVFIRAIV